MIYKKGSTILEVLIAATLISISILAALKLSSNTQKQTDFSRDYNQATVYNNQSIEWLRNMRVELGWGNFANELDLDTAGNNMTYCLNSLPADSSAFASLTPGACTASNFITGTAYQREMVIRLRRDAELRVERIIVEVNTYWQAKAHKVTNETELADR